MQKNNRTEVKTSLYPLVINGSDLQANGSSNNVYRYSFPTSANLTNAKIAVQSIQMFYSWFNITSSNSNNTYQIIFPTLAGSTTLTITMPDGYYDVSSINEYLQSIFIANGLYLVDASGNYVYYAEFQENPNYYSVQLNVYPVPTALPSGYTNPGSMTFPAVTQTPQLVVQSNNFQNIIGFVAGTFPSSPASVTTSILSSFTPQVSTVSSVILTCSLVSNRYANPNTIIYSFTPSGTTFGGQINTSPNELSFIDVISGTYADFTISFLDQSFSALNIRDTNLVITLLLSMEG